MDKVETIKQIYEAFGKGDIPTIIDKLDEDVAWDTQSNVPGVPWLGPRRGKANIPGFFESLAPLQFTHFEP
jgi:ketosteroid isomerase-like protein